MSTTPNSSRIWLLLRLLIWVAVPAVLLVLPSDFFDDGPPMCLSVILLNTECFGCGMTRACMHLIHFDFAGAYFYNALSFGVFPLLAWQWLKWALRDFRRWRALSAAGNRP